MARFDPFASPVLRWAILGFAVVAAAFGVASLAAQRRDVIRFRSWRVRRSQAIAVAVVWNAVGLPLLPLVLFAFWLR